VSDHGVIRQRDERYGERAGFAQRAHDELLVVARMRRIQKRGDRYGFDSRSVRGRFGPDVDVRDQSSIKKLRSCSLRLG